MHRSGRVRVYGLLAVAGLVLATAGSATAARLITGKQIRDGSVTGRDIRQGSITSGDLSSGTIAAMRGAPGPAGPGGPPGPSGQGITAASRAPVTLGPDGCGAGCDIRVVEAICPPGTQAVSGGHKMIAFGQVWYSQRSPEGDGWAVGFDNDGGISSAENEVVVYCAPGAPAPAGRSGGGRPDLEAARRLLD